MAKKGKRGFKFTVAELKHLLDVIDESFPIGNPDWKKVWHEHSAAYPMIEWTDELPQHKFQELVCKKNNRWPYLSSLCLWGQANLKENCYFYQ